MARSAITRHSPFFIPARRIDSESFFQDLKVISTPRMTQKEGQEKSDQQEDRNERLRA